MKCYPFFLLAALICPLNCEAQTVEWLTDDKNDIFYFENGQNYSISHDTLALLLKKIGTDKFTLQPASVARIAAQLQNTDNTCVAGRMKTPERLKQHLFSIPFNLHPMPKLYFNNKNILIPKQALDDKGHLSSLLTLLDANPGKKLAQLMNLSFGAEIDGQIALIPKQQIHIFSVDNRYQAKTQLIIKGFTDLLIAYPVDFVHRGLDVKEYEHISSLYFATGAPYSISHVACSDSQLGRTMIELINDLLSTLHHEEAFLQAHLRYIPEEDKPALLNFYNKTFNTHF